VRRGLPEPPYNSPVGHLTQGLIDVAGSIQDAAPLIQQATQKVFPPLGLKRNILPERRSIGGFQEIHIDLSL